MGYRREIAREEVMVFAPRFVELGGTKVGLRNVIERTEDEKDVGNKPVSDILIRI